MTEDLEAHVEALTKGLAQMEGLAERLSQVEDLTERLSRVEDELQVHRVLVRYGLAVDAGDAEAAMELFTRDTVYEVGSVGTGRDEGEERTLLMTGRAAVGEMVRSEDHQALLPNAAHTIGPAVVQVDGSTAVATSYTRIYHREEDVFRLFRLAVNRFELVKDESVWRIQRRTSRVIGEEDSQDLLRRGLADAQL